MSSLIIRGKKFSEALSVPNPPPSESPLSLPRVGKLRECRTPAATGFEVGLQLVEGGTEGAKMNKTEANVEG